MPNLCNFAHDNYDLSQLSRALRKASLSCIDCLQRCVRQSVNNLGVCPLSTLMHEIMLARIS